MIFNCVSICRPNSAKRFRARNIVRKAKALCNIYIYIYKRGTHNVREWVYMCVCVSSDSRHDRISDGNDEKRRNCGMYRSIVHNGRALTLCLAKTSSTL